MNNEKLTIYGDSIMKGVVLESGRYKIGEKIESFAERIFTSVTNRSKFGSTIEKGVETLEADLDRNVLTNGVVLLEFGGNDCDFDWKEISANPQLDRDPNTAIDKFISLYKHAISLVRKKNLTPVVANLPPISSEKYLNFICRSGLSKENILFWLGDENAIYRYQERYSRAIEEIAESENIPLVDLRGAFLSDRKIEEYLCEDGIHPSLKGQKLIIDTFRRFFSRNGYLKLVPAAD